MHHISLLASAVTLVAWSQVVQVWMFATRFPALRRAGITLRGRRGGPTRTAIEQVVPDHVSWKSHNYVHLMEQPTIFYATVFALVLAGVEMPLSTSLAWTYVALRIVHSIIQGTVNIVTYRLAAFVASSLCLAFLTLQAGFAIALQ